MEKKKSVVRRLYKCQPEKKKEQTNTNIHPAILCYIIMDEYNREKEQNRIRNYILRIPCAIIPTNILPAVRGDLHQFSSFYFCQDNVRNRNISKNSTIVLVYLFRYTGK
jgi:hypothetical protein